ncbi:glycosyltransferase family 9 protein [Rhodococcus fascians]|nr:glycosyltransferase family 9 protein [Rhodococcus fascians]MBY4138446.1 glycosyltransferase family 9 protein [Rhodococcus fascians]MBY4218090.1 glycosyltransferase family 9 protein [Rhodococcus fascians]MBY4220922.1 glycosyltransferase family 9 protein [Rhodococcus fascians]MBY4231082.1 glycosyltransferase family 9 protein [Rhodococcus fascians]
MHRVLALRALGLGDFLTSVPALRALRAHYRDSHLVLATSEWLTPLVRLADCVDDVHGTRGLSPIDIESPIDVAVNLHGRGPQSIDVLRVTDAEVLVTHAHRDRPEIPGTTWEPDLHEVERWCRLLREHGIAADAADLGLARPPVPSPASGAVIVHPGAASRARRWPAERFASIARTLRQAGYDVVVTGNAAESSLAGEVVTTAGLPSAASMAGRLSLVDMAALVADARLVLCGDTGIAHLASAYGTPSVVLFGPTPPARWGPPESGPHQVMWHGTTGDPHADVPDPGLTDISELEVTAAVHAALGRTNPVEKAGATT